MDQKLRQGNAALDRLSWDDLRLFLAIATTGSVRGAARDTGLSVNTVRARLEAMEHLARTTLVDRTPRGLTLTEAGDNVRAAAERMREAAATEPPAKPAPSGGARLIRLAVTEGIGNFWLMPRLAGFAAARPDIQIKLRTDHSAAGQDERDADILVHLRAPAAAEFTVRATGTLHMMPFASPAYLAARGTPRHFSEWRAHRLVWQDWEPDAADIMPLFIADDAPDRIIAMVTSSTAAQHAAIRAGIGLGFLPSFFARIDAGVVPVDFGMAFRRPIHVAVRNPSADADIDQLAALIAEAFADQTLFGETFVAPTA